MIDARVRYRGKRYSLGKYQTEKEADAARAAALRVLDRVEADKPAPVKPTYPSLTLVANLTDMGVCVWDGLPFRSTGILALLDGRLFKSRGDLRGDSFGPWGFLDGHLLEFGDFTGVIS